MEWTWLALLAAFGQAFGWALKKKALGNHLGINSIIGLVSYAVAALALILCWIIFGTLDITLTSRFWEAMTGLIILNIVAIWAGFKAIEQSDLSALMPFVALTAIAIVPVEYLLRGTIPTSAQTFGIIVVVIGALVVATKHAVASRALLGAKYFALTLICYSITSPLQGVTVVESGSGLFAAALFHVGITVGFIPIIFFTREYQVLAAIRNRDSKRWFQILGWMIAAGLTTALLENGPINIALLTGSASEVFALKRTMPFFALVLGVLMFKEHITRRQVVGTILLVIGSVLIVWYR